MRKALLLVAILVFAVYVGSALAVPEGKDVEFAGGAMGKVVFSGSAHAGAGLKCMECHPKLFPMTKAELKVPVPHAAGQVCFACHNGEKAFDFKADCARCHKK
ncbi:MAG: hypothetical protein Kow0025_18750 [Thermodesulfovibrionales bacterium]